MATQLRELDAETLAEMQAFAKQEGRRWRDALLYDYWMKGLPVRGFPSLYGLRNDPAFGPSWLASYKLPKA